MIRFYIVTVSTFVKLFPVIHMSGMEE